MPDAVLILPVLTEQLLALDLLTVLNKLCESYPNEITCVGGCIRDAFFGFKKTPLDLDLIVHNPDLIWNVSESLGIWLEKTPFWLDTVRKIARIQTDAVQLDINALRAETLSEDAMSRDFTLNTLMISLEDLVDTLNQQSDMFFVQDYVQALPDFQNMILRAPNNLTFQDDPLRSLRLIRFKGILPVKVDPATLNWAKEALPILPIVAGERIREEWVQILKLDDLASLLFWCDKENLFGSWFPFLDKLTELDRNYTNPISVKEHTLYTLGYLEQIFLRIKTGNFPHAQEVFNYCRESWVEDRDKFMLLKLAALLHDIGKADTVSWEEDRLRFFGHEERGISLAEPFLIYQGWSRREIDFILQLIQVHMRPHGLSSAAYVSQHAQFRFFRDLDEAAVGTLLIGLADAYATKMIPMGTLTEYEDFISTWLDFAFSPKKNIHKPLLNGDEIMDLLHISPSPVVKNIIEDLMEQESAGFISTKEEAIGYLLEKIQNSRDPNLPLKDEKNSIE